MTEPVTVDARGLSCPQPVLLTKKAMEDNSATSFVILVDNLTSKENVSRFVSNQGCSVEISDAGPGAFALKATRKRSEDPPEDQQELLACPAADPASASAKGPVVYVATDCMGTGDEVLGRKLMRGFLRTWIDINPLPWRMVFINHGVRLTTLDDEVVEALTVLSDRGVEILSCGTCIEHFNLSDKLRIGRLTNMYEVIETLAAATKVISPS